MHDPVLQVAVHLLEMTTGVGVGVAEGEGMQWLVKQCALPAAVQFWLGPRKQEAVSYPHVPLSSSEPYSVSWHCSQPASEQLSPVTQYG